MIDTTINRSVPITFSTDSRETDEGECGSQAQLVMTVTYKFRESKEVA